MVASVTMEEGSLGVPQGSLDAVAYHFAFQSVTHSAGDDVADVERVVEGERENETERGRERGRKVRRVARKALPLGVCVSPGPVNFLRSEARSGGAPARFPSTPSRASRARPRSCKLWVAGHVIVQSRNLRFCARLPSGITSRIADRPDR